MALRILKTSALLLLLLLPGFILSSCKKDSPVEVKKDEPVEVPDTSTPGSRNYEWKLDTLKMVMNDICAIWGSAPNDVWAVGPGGVTGDELWHYDGVKWTISTRGSGQGTCLFGFAKNDVWMGCISGGQIKHFDGTTWSLNYCHKVQGARDVAISSIWGTSPDNVYAAGNITYISSERPAGYWQGILLHYNGYIWKEVYRAEMHCIFSLIRCINNKVYLRGGKIYSDAHENDSLVIFEYDGHSMNHKMSVSERESWLGLNLIGEYIYVWINNDMYSYNDGLLRKKMSIDGVIYPYFSFGRSANDMFIIRKEGLMHYNGSDLQYIYKYPEGKTYMVVDDHMFEKDIFIGLYHNGSNYVLHGKLKE